MFAQVTIFNLYIYLIYVSIYLIFNLDNCALDICMFAAVTISIFNLDSCAEAFYVLRQTKYQKVST